MANRNKPTADTVEMARVGQFQGRRRIAERYAVTIPNIGFSGHEPLPPRADHPGRIEDRRGIHQDLRQERHDVLEVAIEDCQRGQRHADTQRGDERQWDRSTSQRLPQLGLTP